MAPWLVEVNDPGRTCQGPAANDPQGRCHAGPCQRKGLTENVNILDRKCRGRSTPPVEVRCIVEPQGLGPPRGGTISDGQGMWPRGEGAAHPAASRRGG